MKYMLLNQSKINEFYKKVQIAHKINERVLQSEKGDELFLTILCKEVVKLIEPIKDKEEYSDELFQLELTRGLNQCFLNKELTGVYGKLWLASEDNMIKVFNILKESHNS